MRGVVALIPARGGSKRFPRKNVIDFLGRPILAYTIEAARDSGCFERIVVSTEDPEIKNVSIEYGAVVDDRPEALASDEARVHHVCLEYLERQSRQGIDYELLCCLYPTAPLRNAKDIRAVVNLITEDCAFALAVTSYGLPPHQAMRWNDDATVESLFPGLIGKRDSEFGKVVVDNGSTYAVDVAAFRRHGNFIGDRVKGYYMPPQRSPDINYPEDLALAAYYYRQLDSCGS